MTVEVTYLQSGFSEMIQNGGNLVQVEVEVAIPDLPPHARHNISQLFLLPNGNYAFRGYLIPYKDHFQIVPSQNINMQTPLQYADITHADLQKYRQGELHVRALRYPLLGQPTQLESAIIRPI